MFLSAMHVQGVPRSQAPMPSVFCTLEKHGLSVFFQSVIKHWAVEPGNEAMVFVCLSVHR